MTSTRWWQYIEPVISGMTMRDAAKKAGFNQSAFTRWKNGAKADPDFVVKFARAFSLNVLEALAEAEFITEDEANLREVTVDGPALSDATNKQLLDEIMRRSDPEALYLFGDPTGEAIDYENVDAPVTNLDAHRSNTQSVLTDTHLDYVAKRGTPEPEEGDDDYGDGA